MKRLHLVLLVALLAAVWLWPQPPPSATSPDQDRSVAQDRGGRATGPDAAPSNDAQRLLPGFLPAEARHTLTLIARGGPFPHRQDGAIFENRERRLPTQARGWYREYTVRTPGERTRGARRIVTGGDPPSQYWYTDDHYASFRRFEVGK